jgi:hypothetical protein
MMSIAVGAAGSGLLEVQGVRFTHFSSKKLAATPGGPSRLFERRTEPRYRRGA